jgi:hypothetical protein
MTRCATKLLGFFSEKRKKVKKFVDGVFVLYLNDCDDLVSSWEALLLEQAWATSGPRALCDPPNTLMWPANTFFVLLKDI